MEYTFEKLKEIANKYNTRAEWSCGDPQSYDYALFNLVKAEEEDGEVDDSKFLEVTEHMPFNEGRTFSGDPNDPRLLYLKRQLNWANKRVEAYTKDNSHKQDLEIERNRFKRMLKNRKQY